MRLRRFILAIAILGALGLAPQFLSAQGERIPFRDGDTLEEIQQKIEVNGYGFTVGHNWVFDLPPAERARLRARRPLPAGRTDPFAPGIGPLAQVIGRRALPSRFDWRDVGGHSSIGAVRNQGSCGTCYAFAACAAAEGAYNLAHGLVDGSCADFSESYIAWCLGRRSEYRDHFFGCDGADYSYSELQALVDVGVPDEADFPYTVTDPGTCTHDADPRVQMAGWYRIPCGDIEAIKTAIATYGVVDAAIQTTSAFDAYSGGIYEDTNTDCSGTPCEYTRTDHAIALVGWDDTEGVFLLRNSWGTSWGENGYMRIKYTSAVVACEVCYFVPETPTGRIELSRTALNFGTVGTLATTGGQTVTLSNGGSGTLDWTASTSDPWITVTPTSGSGNAVLTVSVNASGRPFGTSTGSVSLFSAQAANSPQTVQVVLRKTTSGSAPTGSFDTPLAGATGLHGNVPVTGWALDDVEVVAVKLYRQPVTGETSPAGGLVYIGDADFVEGARPDLETANSAVPFNYRAGWGYMMLSNFLPADGNGRFTLVVVATDREGRSTTLGSHLIIVDNAHATTPFGTLDTPEQGGAASGTAYVNFGWALTPLPATIPTDGSTIWVWVDGTPLGHPVYNQYRADIATLFPTYHNAGGAVGYYMLDTTSLANGTHTIAWSIRDDLGREDGVGSRYFQVMNGAASAGLPRAGRMVPPLAPSAAAEPRADRRLLQVRRGWNPEAPFMPIASDERGKFCLRVPEVGRLEIQLREEGKDEAGSRWTGFQTVGGQLRPLPFGAMVDPWRGTFCWQPGPGFLGLYRFTLCRGRGADWQREIDLEVTVVPASRMAAEEE